MSGTLLSDSERRDLRMAVAQLRNDMPTLPINAVALVRLKPLLTVLAAVDGLISEES